MATYWKSQPKKHCDFCKCWIADNRPSIDFHERGKRHQENVEKKIAELRKKGQEQYEMQKTLDSDLKKMEKDALKAFKKDLVGNSALAAEYKAKAAATEAQAAAVVKRKEERLQAARSLLRQGQSIIKTKHPGKTNKHKPSSSSPLSPSESTRSKEALPMNEVPPTEEKTSPLQCVWLEGMSPDGDTYYWNSLTGESRWDRPEDYEETNESTQYKQPSTTISDEVKKEDDEHKDCASSQPSSIHQPSPAHEPKIERVSSSEEENEGERSGSEVTIKRKGPSAYGSWSTVVVETAPPVDLQLPQSDRPHFEPIVPKAAQHQPRERLKFKERVVKPLATSSKTSSEEKSFKRRKFGSSGRSIRQRDNDT